MDKEKGEELEEYNIILSIPKAAADLTVTAKFIEGDKVVTAEKHMTVAEIHEARQAFLDNVEDGDDYDARYALTEKGLRFKEFVEAKRKAGDDRSWLDLSDEFDMLYKTDASPYE